MVWFSIYSTPVSIITRLKLWCEAVHQKAAGCSTAPRPCPSPTHNPTCPFSITVAQVVPTPARVPRQFARSRLRIPLPVAQRLQKSPTSGPNYSSSSTSICLSAGAIAGITIACVVVACCPSLRNSALLYRCEAQFTLCCFSEERSVKTEWATVLWYWEIDN